MAEVTPTMNLNNKVVQQVSQTEIAFQRCCRMKSCCDALFKKNKCYSASVWFRKRSNYRLSEVRFIVSQYCVRVGRDPLTVCRLWRKWFQVGYAEHRIGFQWAVIISSREDIQLTRMTLMNHTTVSWVLSQKMRSFAKHQATVQTTTFAVAWIIIST